MFSVVVVDRRKWHQFLNKSNKFQCFDDHYYERCLFATKMKYLRHLSDTFVPPQAATSIRDLREKWKIATSKSTIRHHGHRQRRALWNRSCGLASHLLISRHLFCYFSSHFFSLRPTPTRTTTENTQLTLFGYVLFSLRKWDVDSGNTFFKYTTQHVRTLFTFASIRW